MTKAQMENRWGVKIVNEEYWNPRRQKFVKDYVVYSADGCTWDKGFTTLKGVEAMCKEDSKTLLLIRDRVRQTRANAAHLENMRVLEQLGY